GLGPQVGERGLHRLAHHLAEVAREREAAALAGHHRGLDEQDVAADGRPGKPGGHARPIGALGDLGEEARAAEVLDHALWRDHERRELALGEVARRLAAAAGDLALEVAHAGLARVVANDVAAWLPP